MNNFGKIKSALLKKMSDAYYNNDKKEIKELLNIIKENKEFKEMYLFYENIENKFLEDKEIAIQYVNALDPILKKNMNKLSSYLNEIKHKFDDVIICENDIYDSIDSLLIEDTIDNIDKKIVAKRNLVEHISSKKQNDDDENYQIVENENLLCTVLTNTFNITYDATLSESEKTELSSILSLTNEELNSNIINLKENILLKVNQILTESDDLDLKNKLNEVKSEMFEMSNNKINYYKLSQLDKEL